MKHGAHITKECLERLDDAQIKELRHARHEYKKEHLVGIEGKIGAVLDKISGSRAKHKEEALKQSFASQMSEKNTTDKSFGSKVWEGKAVSTPSDSRNM